MIPQDAASRFFRIFPLIQKHYLLRPICCIVLRMHCAGLLRFDFRRFAFNRPVFTRLTGLRLRSIGLNLETRAVLRFDSLTRGYITTSADTTS